MSTTVTSERRPQVGPAHALVAVVLLLGLGLSTLAANSAIGMGEAPVTLLPFAPVIAAWGLPALVAARAGATAVVWLLAARLAPRYRLHAVAAVGLVWLAWGGWQFWVLLALT